VDGRKKSRKTQQEDTRKQVQHTAFEFDHPTEPCCQDGQDNDSQGATHDISHACRPARRLQGKHKQDAQPQITEGETEKKWH
jgi:hypothetical protein